MVFYNNFMPKRFQGYTFGFFTFIRPSHRNNIPLHIHEEVHRNQFRKDWFMPLRYAFDKSERLRYEIDAYHAQYKAAPSAAKLAALAGHLVNSYGFNIDTLTASYYIERGLP